MGRAFLVAAVAIIVLFVFWLIADREIQVGEGPGDELFFIQKAKSWYWFDEGFTILSFIKEPVYPLFMAMCYRLGLPLRLMTEVLYLAAAGFLAYALVLRQSRPLVGLLVFAVCALHPMHFIVFGPPLYDSIYTSLLMVTLGAVLLQFKLGDEPGRWCRPLATGLALGVLYNTRPDRPWVLLLIIGFLIAAAVWAWCHHPTLGVRLRACARECLLPVAGATVLTMAIMTANYARWGIFAISQQETPGFVAARRALMSIQPKRPVRFCLVTRKMWEKAYAVSPTFRHLQPCLNKDHPVCAITRSMGYPPGEMGDWFWWALRDAAAAKGYYTSGPVSEAFYYRIADEINTAAAAGRLPTRWVLVASLDPCLDNWLPFLVPTFRDVWSLCWADWGFYELPPEPPDAPPQSVALFNEVARRRWVDKGPTPQSQVRTWMWLGYERLMDLALADGGLVLVAVLLLHRAAPGWRAYLLTAAALGFVGFSRLSFLTLAWASNGTTAEPRYLLPAAVALSIVAIWLLAEGVRLLGSAVVYSFRMAPGLAPVATGWRRWLTPGRGTTVGVLALTAAAILLVDLRLLARPHRVLLGATVERGDNQPDKPVMTVRGSHLLDLASRKRVSI
jgi:hypothetical protein